MKAPIPDVTRCHLDCRYGIGDLSTIFCLCRVLGGFGMYDVPPPLPELATGRSKAERAGGSAEESESSGMDKVSPCFTNLVFKHRAGT